MSKLMTLYKILPGCEEGNPEAWRAFLANYTHSALQFFAIYSPWSPDARLECWREALGALSANACAALKGLSHQSEREFLVGLRSFLQEWAAPRLDPAQDAADPTAPTIQTLGDLLNGLPLLHQEMAFLTLAGYSQSTLEMILRITPSVAEQGLDRLRAGYSAVLHRSDDRCLWPSAWIGICKVARAEVQKDCTPLRQLVRVHDGQASWYDKSPVETHRSKCLHCLELWTSVLEVVAWDRSRQPLPADEIEPLLEAVPLKRDKRKASLFARMLGK
jgi:hypothetical protein